MVARSRGVERTVCPKVSSFCEGEQNGQGASNTYILAKVSMADNRDNKTNYVVVVDCLSTYPDIVLN